MSYNRDGGLIMRLLDKKATKTSLGCLSKGWYQDEFNKKYLVKGNSSPSLYGISGYEPFSEVLAYRLGKLLDLPVIEYWLAPAVDFPEIHTYNCDWVSICPEISRGRSQLVSYCYWADQKNKKEVKDYFNFYLKSELSNESLIRLLVFDAVIGNPDRHLNNFDLLVGEHTELAPIFDNGAALLSTIAESALKKSNGVGFDKAKPFKPTHDQQIKLLKQRFPDVTVFNVNTKNVYNRWIVECEDIFQLLSTKRAEAIKHYVKQRLVYLEKFNSTITHGGEVSAINVFR